MAEIEKSAGTGRRAFRFQEDPEAPSHFDLQFIAQNTLYRFGIVLDDDQIIEEWLMVDRWRIERGSSTSAKPIKKEMFTVKGLTKRRGRSWRLLKTVVAHAREQSFLATIRATLDQDEYGPVRKVIDWFQR